MNAYRPTSTRTRFVIAALTLVLSSALLETVAGSMLHADPGAVRVVAAPSAPRT